MYSQNLKKIRNHFGLSVDELALKLDIPSRTIGGYERNERTPSIELGTQLCNKLGVNLNWFVTGEGEMLIKEKKDFTGVDFTVEDAQQVSQRLNGIELRLKKLEDKN